MNYTKDKWELLIIEPNASRLIIRDTKGIVCEIEQRDDGISNANLMKAAPDMHNILNCLINDTEHFSLLPPHWKHEIYKVVAKAEGK